MDPTVKSKPPRLSVEAEMVAAVLHALENAPHKYRIDFQVYWEWYDGPRAAAVAKAQALLNSTG